MLTNFFFEDLVLSSLVIKKILIRYQILSSDYFYEIHICDDIQLSFIVSSEHIKRRIEFIMNHQFTYRIVDEKPLCNITPATQGSVVPMIDAKQKKENNSKVKVLKVSEIKMTAFPRNLLKTFPSMMSLQITDCGIEQISREDLIGFGDIEKLDMSFNKLKSLPDDLFADMPKLRFIKFASNKIETLSSKLLDPIKLNLDFADFRDNSKINHYFFHGDIMHSLEGLIAAMNNYCHQPPVQFIDQTDSRFKKFEHFMTSGKYSDFIINVRGKEFKVHKNILAAQSSVFDAMFSSDTEEGANILQNIKNFSESSFSDFLRFFYTGSLKTEENATELFELAAKFDVPMLKTKCEQIILQNLHEANAPEVFNLGHLHSQVLKQGAFAKVKEAFAEIDDHLYNEIDLVNEIINTKRRLQQLIKQGQDAKTKKSNSK